MWSQSQECIYNLSPKWRHFESKQGATDATSRKTGLLWGCLGQSRSLVTLLVPALWLAAPLCIPPPDSSHRLICTHNPWCGTDDSLTLASAALGSSAWNSLALVGLAACSLTSLLTFTKCCSFVGPLCIQWSLLMASSSLIWLSL